MNFAVLTFRLPGSPLPAVLPGGAVPAGDATAQPASGPVRPQDAGSVRPSSRTVGETVGAPFPFSEGSSREGEASPSGI